MFLHWVRKDAAGIWDGLFTSGSNCAVNFIFVLVSITPLACLNWVSEGSSMPWQKLDEVCFVLSLFLYVVLALSPDPWWSVYLTFTE